MIQSSSLIQSYKNRSIQWGWHLGDDFPILQLAASNGKDFADAMEIAYKWTSGVDLNCGCPKQNVRKMGCGSALLKNPERIADIIKQAKSRISNQNYPISVKLRILSSPEKTVEMCRMVRICSIFIKSNFQLEHAGVDRIGLHIRTVENGGNGPTCPEFATLVKSSIKIPLFVNGGIRNLRQVFELAKVTNADGIMVANGLLNNPALFSGYAHTPFECISKFVDEAILEGMGIDFFHQHLIFMMRFLLGKRERQVFNNCASIPHILTFLKKLEVF